MARANQNYSDVEPYRLIDDPMRPSTAKPSAAPEHAKRQFWAQRRKAMEISGARFTPVGVKLASKSPIFDFCLSVFEKTLRLTGLWRVGHQNARNIRVRHLELYFDNLPKAFDGYRILHLTDLHIDKFSGLEDVIINAVAGLNIDLCAMTGDFRAADDGPHEQIMAPMQRLVDAINAPDGTYAVLGNHDDHQLGLSLERRLGIKLLANEQATVQRGDDSITLAGADDVNRFYTADATEVLALNPDAFSIALVHSPEMATDASDAGQSLYLCGHTHGGQVCLPGGKPLVTHLSRNKDLASGLWNVGKMQRYTSPGAGVSGPPVRFFSQGEVTVFHLRRPQETKSVSDPTSQCTEA